LDFDFIGLLLGLALSPQGFRVVGGRGE